MSLSKAVFETIDNNIKLHISQVASRYNIPENELYEMWYGDSPPVKQVVTKIPVSSNSSTNIIEDPEPELMKLTKKELSELCKGKNLAVSGTKNDLIKRIMEAEKTPKLFQKTESKGKTSQPEVIKKLADKIPTIEIRKNSHGNFEHTETHLVINNTTKKVYGRQNYDGTISELTPGDIDLCHKYKFAYILPENLDKKNVGSLEDDEEDDELGDDEE